jgi:hypothetical protein
MLLWMAQMLLNGLHPSLTEIGPQCLSLQGRPAAAIALAVNKIDENTNPSFGLQPLIHSNSPRMHLSRMLQTKSFMFDMS